MLLNTLTLHNMENFVFIVIDGIATLSLLSLISETTDIISDSSIYVFL